MANSKELAELPPEMRRASRRRRWVRYLIWSGLCGLFVSVALLPQAMSWPAMRHLVLNSFTSGTGMRLQVASLQLHWLRPPVLQGLQLSSRQGEPLLALASARGELPLYRWLPGSRQLGTVTLQQPRFYWTRWGPGNNWSRASGGTPAGSLTRDDALRILDAVGKRDLRLVVAEGRLVFEDAGRGRAAWTAGDLSATVEVKRAADGSPQLLLERGRMLENVNFSPAMVDDLLKFVAPALADATDVAGRFSWENEVCVLPLRDPSSGYLAGTLEIHDLRAGPGTLVTAWADVLGWPLTLQMMEACRIEFEMVDRRVFHRGFQLRMGQVQVETEGWVGLDEQLDVVAQLRWPAQLGTGRGHEERMVRLPVSGSLRQPRIDWLSLVEENAHWAGDIGQRIIDELPELRARLRQLRSLAPDRPLEAGAEEGEREPPLLRLRRLLPRLRPRPPEPAGAIAPQEEG